MEIKLYNDIVFKWIFGRQEQTYPLICFLNAVVSYDLDGSDYAENIKPTFSEVEILNPYDSSEPFTNEKQGILDIRAKDINSQEWIDLEIQVIRTSDYKERSKYYLAGMYRDQLKKGGEHNYDELRACYGIHLLVDSIFEEKDEADFWFNHYRMLNIRTHKPLINHWNLYYVELNKFLKCFEKAKLNKKVGKDAVEQGDKTIISFSKELEQWSYFIGTIQDNAKPLPSVFNQNRGIEEVFNMLQTFTKDERLREQYRLHEEFIRVQRGEEARKEKLKQQYKIALRELGQERKAKEEERKAKEEERKAKEMAVRISEEERKAREEERKAKEEERKAKEEERKAKEEERKAKEEERKAKEEERKAKEAALQKNEELQLLSVLSLRKAGYSNGEIAEMLNISLAEVERIQ
ncbi:MAG: PD-(D/E)XK nuclease family transposase [Desulfamplus sp.]|nr:PD-(D/E)XK nuclease family transposase [Desulfamplus sp.]